MSQHWTNTFITLCCSALLFACSNQPPRPATDTAVTLPRDYARALEYMRIGDYPSAIDALQDFTQGQPDHAGPYLNLGIAYRQSGNLGAARDALEKVLAINPSQPEVHNQLGMLYREQGDFERALRSYHNALRLAPDAALAHRNLGILYDLYLQQPVLALDHYQRFLELEHDDSAEVSNWVVDLERRTRSTRASAQP